jgi:hypothetical protein
MDHCVNGVGVMALDEAFTPVSVPFTEVKSARLAGQAAERGKRPLLLSLNECRIAFIAPVGIVNLTEPGRLFAAPLG